LQKQIFSDIAYWRRLAAHVWRWVRQQLILFKDYSIPVSLLLDVPMGPHLLLTLAAGLAIGADGQKAASPKPSPAAGVKSNPDALRRAAMNSGGNAARGKTLFESNKTKCAVCHKVHGKGGDAGPDLSQIGGKFDRTHLIESILDPSAEILQGYQSTIIETKSGRVLTGIIKSESATEIKLVDVDAKLITVPVGDVESRRLSKVSLMPAGLAEVMPPAEFTDLIAYLESLCTGPRPTPGQGVGGTLTLPPGFRADVVATGLTGATALEVTGDGRVFVCEQTGTLRVIKDGKLLPKPFLKLAVDSTWERGLIGVTVAPDFPKTPHVFVCYVAAKPYPHHVISRFTGAGDTAEPGSEKILLEGDDQRKLGGEVPAGHQGGALHFGKDGKLYIAIGEQTAGKPAQDLHSLLGKLLRINPDGSIPSDNPFLAKTTGKYRAIWALGLRNPFTFAVDCQTGRLFINDVGGVAEEINEGFAGANYGWPVIEHGPTTDPRFRGPIHHYPTACVIGGAFAPRNLHWPNEYRGQYFFGDFSHGWIKTIDPDRPAQAHSFATGLRRPVDLRFGPDGKLYVLLRDAWVIDDLFKGGTGAVLAIRHVASRSP
jgi:putative heme-binding domain-containing protein